MSYPDGPLEHWYRAPKDEAHQKVFDFVRRTEQEQGDVYDRLQMLESLYDPYSPTGDDSTSPNAKLANVSENVVAANVDTVYASVASVEVRARFLTDGADWSVQRRAKKMEYYTEGLGKLHNVHRKCRIAFKGASKKGGAGVKVYGDRWEELVVEPVQLDDLVVPDCDSRAGAPPLQLHHVQRNYDREKLRAEYPEYAEDIDTSYGQFSMTTNAYSLLARSKITVIESIRLPIGKKPANGTKSKRGARYVPGRRTVTIENKTLEDGPYHKPYYPVAMVTWSDREGSFYGISGSERIAGHQRSLNKRNWQIERVLDQNALLTTYVRPADGNLAVKTTKIGNVAVIKGDYPETPNPPLVATETYNSRVQLKQSAAEDFGGAGMLATQSRIPAGLETGAAVREARASVTQRFAPQESDFEQLVLDVNFLMIDACKDLGPAAPAVLESRWHKPIKWSDVDMGQVKIQIAAASTLPRTPAGREQTLLEWAQAGIISTDSAKRLIDHPDLDRELSMYTSALEVIEMQLEVILDGGISTPEPLDNIEMAQWRGTATYNNARMGGAPEEILEALHDYVTLAAFISAQRQEQNDNAMPGAGASPMPMPSGAQPPGASQPAAALSPQAMQLMAS